MVASAPTHLPSELFKLLASAETLHGPTNFGLFPRFFRCCLFSSKSQAGGWRQKLSNPLFHAPSLEPFNKTQRSWSVVGRTGSGNCLLPTAFSHSRLIHPKATTLAPAGHYPKHPKALHWSHSLFPLASLYLPGKVPFCSAQWTKCASGHNFCWHCSPFWPPLVAQGLRSRPPNCIVKNYLKTKKIPSFLACFSGTLILSMMVSLDQISLPKTVFFRLRSDRSEWRGWGCKCCLLKGFCRCWQRKTSTRLALPRVPSRWCSSTMLKRMVSVLKSITD